MSGDYGRQQFQRQQFRHKPSDVAKKDVDHEAIKAELAKPAKGLLFSGIASVVLVILGTLGGLVYGGVHTDRIVDNLIWQIYGVDQQQEKLDRNNNPDPKAAEQREKRRAAQANTVLTMTIGGIIIGAAVLAAFYCFAIAGGVLMGQLRNYNLCKLSCIVAMIPIVSPLLVLGIPFGMMGLAKLNKPEIKRAFSKG